MEATWTPETFYHCQWNGTPWDPYNPPPTCEAKSYDDLTECLNIPGNTKSKCLSCCKVVERKDERGNKIYYCGDCNEPTNTPTATKTPTPTVTLTPTATPTKVPVYPYYYCVNKLYGCRDEYFANKAACDAKYPNSGCGLAYDACNKACKGVSPTPTPTPTLTPTPTQTPTPIPKCKKCVEEIGSSYSGGDRAGGDFNCDGLISGLDYNIWREEFIKEYKKFSNYWRADGGCNGQVLLSDYSRWSSSYLKL